MDSKAFVQELEASNPQLLAQLGDLRTLAGVKLGTSCFPGC